MSASVSLFLDCKGNCPVFTKFGRNVISLESTQTYFYKILWSETFWRKEFLLPLNGRIEETPSALRQTETELLIIWQILLRNFASGLKEVHILRRGYNDIVPV